MTNAEESFWKELRDGLDHRRDPPDRDLLADTETLFETGFSMEDAERLMRSDVERDGEPLSEQVILEMVKCAVASPPVRVARPRLVVTPADLPVRPIPQMRPMEADRGSRSRLRRLVLTSHWLAASVTGAALLLAFGTVMTLWPNDRKYKEDLSYARAIDVMMGLDPSAGGGSRAFAAGWLYTQLKAAVRSLGEVRTEPGPLGARALTGLHAIEAALLVSHPSVMPQYVEASSLTDLAERLKDPETTGRETLADLLSLQALHGVRAMVALQRSLPPGRERGMLVVEIEKCLVRLQRLVRRGLGKG